MADTEAEREMSRTEVADYLRRFADELDTTTTTRTEHQSGTPATPEDEHQQRGETRSASEEESSDESGVLDSLADDDHENEEDEDHRNHSDRDRAGESGQSPQKVTFMVGNDSTTINPPETVAFEMAVDSESALIGTETGRTARFALHWDNENVSEDEALLDSVVPNLSLSLDDFALILAILRRVLNDKLVLRTGRLQQPAENTTPNQNSAGAVAPDRALSPVAGWISPRRRSGDSSERRHRSSVLPRSTRVVRRERDRSIFGTA